MDAPTGTEAEELLRTIALLERLVADPALVASLPEADRIRLLAAAGRISRPSKFRKLRLSHRLRKQRRRLKHQGAREADRALRASTGIQEARRAEVFSAPLPALPAPEAPVRETAQPRSCYVCKTPFTRLHHFYDRLCPDCAELNYAKRFQTADLSGRSAYVTGARVKIGY